MSTVSRLEEKIRHQRQTIQRKNAEIKRLQDALQVFLSQMAEEDPAASDDDKKEEGEDEYDGEGEENLPEPIYDGQSIYYCSSCLYEVVDGKCTMEDCGLRYRWIEDGYKIDSISTVTQAIHPDRSLAPRGHTPLLDFDEPEYPPTEYSASTYPFEVRPSRLQEYIELRRRGASRLMCETFHLEFTDEKGIYAWADSELFEQFSGNQMQEGHQWKIHLGRCVTLDPDDFDGAAFIEGLLEDALLFPFQDPLSGRDFEQWETVEEAPGVWITRMKCYRDDTSVYGAMEEIYSSPEDEEDLYDTEDEYEDLYDAEDDENDTLAARYQAIDEAFEHPPVDNGPIRMNEYSLSDDDFEEGDYKMEDSGFSWRAAYPDRVYSLDDELDELDEDDEIPSVSDLIVCNTEEVTSELSCDSDFDDDEVLSGDEDAIDEANMI